MNQSAMVKSRVSPWLISLVDPLARYIVIPFMFGKIKVSGQENIPTSGPVIVAPTHRSRWDALIVPYSTGKFVSGRDLHFMVTSSEVKGLQGWFIKRLGGFPVNVERPELGSLRHSVQLLLEQKMMVIFPEGGIFRDDKKVHKLKRGVARIALEAEAESPGIGVKILPMSIKYSQLYPSIGTQIEVKIGTPLNVADYKTESLKKSSVALRQDLETTLKQLYEVKDESVEIVSNSA